VLTIANSVDPEYLVIEPTGVGMLSNIVRNIQQIEYERISLLAPVTIVDGKSFSRYIKEYEELYRDQIASAHTVLVSKMEHADGAELLALEQKLRKINPTGQIIAEHYTSLSMEQWNSFLERGYDGSILAEAHPESEELPDSFSLKGAAMDCPERLIWMLEMLIRGYFGNIFRAKGKFRAGEQILRFEVADGRYSVQGEDSCEEGKAVFIGTDIKRQALRKNFMIRSEKIRIRGRKTPAFKNKMLALYLDEC
jgi:G3E family GTPase